MDLETFTENTRTKYLFLWLWICKTTDTQGYVIQYRIINNSSTPGATQNIEKAVDVLCVYDEEAITPEKTILDYLTNQLNTKKMEIPEILQKFLPQSTEVFPQIRLENL